VEDGQTHGVARAQDPESSCRSRSSWAQQFTAPRGQVRAGRRNHRGVKEIVEGKHDEMPKQDFYLVGSIDDGSPSSSE